MAVSVQMPALGESVTEGTVTRWLKQEGDTVEVDEPLLEVSTDKVDTEIPSPAAGVLTKIVAQEDDTVGSAASSRRSARPAKRRQPHRTGTGPEPPAAEPAGARAGARRSGPARTRAAAPAPAGATGPPPAGGGSHAGPDARARRVGHRGNRHPVAEEGRRRSRSTIPGRGVHRQGRHRDPVAGRGDTAVNHRRGGRRRRRGRQSWPRSVTPAGCRPLPCRAQAQARSPSQNRNQARARTGGQAAPAPQRPHRHRHLPRAQARTRARGIGDIARRQPVCDSRVQSWLPGQC